MIHHISIPATDTRHVADVLVERWTENAVVLELLAPEMTAADLAARPVLERLTGP